MLTFFRLPYHFSIVSLKSYKQMFKRLFLSSELQKALYDAKVDNTHCEINTVHLQSLLPIFSSTSRQSNAKKGALFREIIKRVNSSHSIMSIKGLIAAHYFINKTNSVEFMNVFSQQLSKLYSKEPVAQDLSNRSRSMTKEAASTAVTSVANTRAKSVASKDVVKSNPLSQKDDFVQQNVIAFYSRYLQKMISKREIYDCANQQRDRTLDAQTTASYGFAVINLMNFILSAQSTFNKMGRYYSNHLQIFNLFKMCLTDLQIYNSFIKRTATRFLIEIKTATTQQTKHLYLFIVEAQKTSDRLYQFFYNRYFFSKMANRPMPTFLHIDLKQYQQFVTQVKKVDYGLVELVRRNRFEDTKTSKTNKTELNKTILTQMNQETKINSLFFSFQMQGNGQQESVQEVEQKSLFF